MRDSWRPVTGLSTQSLTAAACGTTVPLSELSTVQSGSARLSEGAGTGLRTGLVTGTLTGLQASFVILMRTCCRRS